MGRKRKTKSRVMKVSKVKPPVKGERGVKGQPGTKGDRGDKGESGVKGDRGDKGESGVKGEKGPEGPQGLRGFPGRNGRNGKTGSKTFVINFFDKDSTGDVLQATTHITKDQPIHSFIDKILHSTIETFKLDQDVLANVENKNILFVPKEEVSEAVKPPKDEESSDSFTDITEV